MSQQSLPLAGFRVIDYSHFLAGPYVGRWSPARLVCG
jgi:formyl-CoA transferase